MPRWKPYPAYKPSNLSWLGDIPAHWEVKRLKDAVQINSETLPETMSPDFALRYIDISNVDEISGINPPVEMRFADAPSRARRIVRAGDTIVSTVRTYLKAIAYFENPEPNLIVSTGFAVLRPSDEIIPEFLYQLVRSKVFIETVVAHSVGVGYPAINPSELSGLKIWLPSKGEQRAIAAFLDHETARLDTLIAKKEQLIERLQEKRTALISRAVTKGLNAHARMKDSGVEWLGEAPEHWEVRRLKQVASKLGSGKTPLGGAQVYQDAGVIFLRSQNVHFDGLRLDDVVYIGEKIDQEMSSSRVHPQDILLNITGASLGRCSIVPNDFPRANVNQHVCVIRPIVNHVNPMFLQSCIASPVVQAQIFSSENGTSREGLTFSQIGNLLLVLPLDVQEQRAIAEYLDRETEKIDALVAKIRDGIARLREYRGALIAAAVTGKIDVRPHP